MSGQTQNAVVSLATPRALSFARLLKGGRFRVQPAFFSGAHRGLEGVPEEGRGKVSIEVCAVASRRIAHAREPCVLMDQGGRCA